MLHPCLRIVRNLPTHRLQPKGLCWPRGPSTTCTPTPATATLRPQTSASRLLCPAIIFSFHCVLSCLRLDSPLTRTPPPRETPVHTWRHRSDLHFPGGAFISPKPVGWVAGLLALPDICRILRCLKTGAGMWRQRRLRKEREGIVRLCHAGL